MNNESDANGEGPGNSEGPRTVGMPRRTCRLFLNVFICAQFQGDSRRPTGLYDDGAADGCLSFLSCMSCSSMTWTAVLASLLALCATAPTARCSTPDDSNYFAAVVDFAAPRATGKPALQNMMDNVRALGPLVHQAAQSADIIVFPEDGLQGFDNEVLPLSVPAPGEGGAPCDDDAAEAAAGQPLRELSCLARTHGVYLVVNLVDEQPCAAGDAKCPARGSYHYNTNVVFDRSGKIVAKYHKYNLFGEKYDDVPPAVELVTFDTDFGVRFGMFICFDIFFDTPAAQLVRERNVTDIIFSAAWFSEVPFLTAVQMHSGWAHALDVTVLASGMNSPAVGSTGSGIYRGRHGIYGYTMNWRQEHTLVFARVPKRAYWQDGVRPQPFPDRLDPVRNYGAGADPYADVSALHMKKDNLTLYRTELLPRPARDQVVEAAGHVCHGAFCCHYDVQMRGVALFQTASAAVSLHGGYSRPRAAATVDEEDEEAKDDFDGFYYRVVAFSGVKGHKGGVISTGTQVCGLVSCLSEDARSCFGQIVAGLDSPSIKWTEFQSVYLEAEFPREDGVQFASTLVGPRYDPLPASAFSLERRRGAEDGTQNLSLELTQRQPLLDLRAFAIYGRNFAWDGQPPTDS
ncbi:vanin-like protein 1 isoform X2 [Frankliniella occidentalis]|uniref:Vanin-like protein 1 isoform X2 n=1 Tax=Frankliniella occidentalis TaxID=133901 RepID=A0A9C6XA54_FRAOC|nr:vanin-like protein 1 isoform X2 [Frankliniella occidentalis]